MCRRGLVLPLVVLLLLAGCNSVAPGSTSTPTASPVAVPTDSPTASPAPRLPPGLSADGVHDPVALVNAHDRVTARSSHTIDVREVHRYDNGTLRWRQETRRRIAGDEPRQHTTITMTGTAPGFGSLRNASRLETYRDGRLLYGYVSNDTTTRYYRTAAPENTLSGRPLVVLFSAVDAEVDGWVTRNGTRLYRVDAVRVTDPAGFAAATPTHPDDRIRNASFDALVDARGLVHEYRMAYTVVPANGPVVHVNRTVRYRALGNTTVEEPAWYEAAVANTSGE